MKKHLKQLHCLSRMMQSAQCAVNVWLELGETEPARRYITIRDYLRGRFLAIREQYFAELDSDFTVAKINGDSALMADIIELKMEWI